MAKRRRVQSPNSEIEWFDVVSWIIISIFVAYFALVIYFAVRELGPALMKGLFK